MKSVFPGHFANDPQDLQRLWDRSLIAVDANVLLNLYRYSEGTRNEFLDLFEKLADRLWISHQVAKEYLKNRLKVISDQAKTYDIAIQGLTDLRKNFENPKQHPFVGAQVLDDCKKSFDLIIGELEQNKERHDQKITSDDIKEAVSRIFEGKVGSGFNEQELEDIIAVGEVRYENKIPPGFKDSDKAGGKSLEERLAPYGDYIGWLQLINKAKSDTQDVIFVTGDNKEDWWLKQSGRTIGPLPELIDEFMSMTSQRFYMYSPDRFLQQAGDFLKQEVSVQAMEEVREVRLAESVRNDIEHLQPKYNAWKKTSRKYEGRKDPYTFLDGTTALYDSGYEGRDPIRYKSTLHFHANVLRNQVMQLSSELSERLVGEPSAQFENVPDAQLERMLSEARQELNATLNLIASIDAAKNIEDEK
ncbi:PIN-like domain-containing protein [Pseudomonas wadenswilerensis]|uniref:PIN like domain-containing protein n=2 Tax=Pseudomonas wadenswilerensis TaxID=1785161 RepID=A0A380T1I8_9PSED|nr:hypothetical protein CCOS864_03543 [Pseudomonas wadenswilerensis]